MEEATRETTVPAEVDEAWEAVTDPERMADWLGDDAIIELEPGGDFEITVGDERRSGFVEEVSEPRRLVFWWSAEEAEASRVEIELEPDGDDTRVRIVESRPLHVLDAGGDLAERIGGGTSPQMSAPSLALTG
jgi:uncharacterized protein YndB with AHSA1/START domain